MAALRRGDDKRGGSGMANSPSGTDTEFENPPPGEKARIDNVTKITNRQLDRRYSEKKQPSLRGVHPKDHGCVEALFTVSPDLPAALRVGAFSPGVAYRAAIRFSNASAVVSPDSLEPQKDKTMKQAHGSRGMAIKLYDVPGERLLPNDGERSQDFLMINQPVFAFANVEDYEALSIAIKEDDTKAEDFFRRPGLSAAAIKRLQKSGGIISQIKSLASPPPPALLFPFQEPPPSPLDNRYFSAAPFLFGKGRVMKFSANPVNPMSGPLGPAIDDPDYLRKALRKRMAEAGGKEICFDFQIQVRGADSLADKIDTDMEDMCTLWDEKAFPFVTVARITIPSQDIATPARQKFCETLFYTPWHGLRAHRPLGGINRLRQKVYQASAEHRGSKVSPALPPAAKKGK
jgi:hypothetical protein